MARLTWLCTAVMIALLGCKVGDPDVSFDGGLFDDDAGLFDEQPGDGDAAVGDGDVGDGNPDDAGAGDGDMGDGDGDATPPDPTAEDWPRLLADATCNALEACMGEELLFEALGRDCRTVKEGLLRNGELAFLPNSVAAGLATFEPSALPDCLADIEELECDAEAARLPDSCEAAIEGAVPFGERCTINQDCQGDHFCDHDEDCDGICVPPLPEGSVCTRNDDAQCQDGLICFCDDRAEGGGCNVDTTCQPFGQVGDPCLGGEPACTPGLLCLDFGGATLECATLDTLYVGTEGQPCEKSVELCISPLVCESTGEGAEGTEGVCRPTVGEGETCRRADPNQCPPHQHCDADTPGVDGICVDRPGDGEPCLSGGRTPACIDGHRCIEGTCVSLKHNGDACQSPRECYSGECEAMVCAGPAMCAAP